MNGDHYWAYAALNADSNELIAMGIYPSRNIYTSKYFIIVVSKLCEENQYSLLMGSMVKLSPQELGSYRNNIVPFGLRSRVESVYSSFK